MVHALPTPPGRRRARAIAAVAVVVVLALVVVGLVVRSRHTSNSGQSTTAATSTGPSATTPSPAPSTTKESTGTTPVTPSTTTPATPTSTTPSSATPTTTTPTTTTPTSSPTATPATPKVDLVVMNNTGRNGLASTARSRFEAKGWKVTDIANFSGGVISTCAFYNPANPDNKRAAEALQAEFPAIKRVEPRFSRLPSAPIVVILTNDYH